MTTIAQMVRARPDPYEAAISCFAHRNVDREAHRVTFWFDDGSSLIFQITYSPIDGEVQA
jgi:hypothetical protein